MYTAKFDDADEFAIASLTQESLVRTFMWAQWDASNQVLYHIHNRRAPTSLVTEDEAESRSKTVGSSPTLSGLQFHDDLPHETVVSWETLSIIFPGFFHTTVIILWIFFLPAFYDRLEYTLYSIFCIMWKKIGT